ncbi:MAG TPA: S9 family peptidase [Acidimicrobiales bacterium]|nr:S9 family peptidase [Acidimicrobiales bacterium]
MADIERYLQARVAVPAGWSMDGSRLLVASNLSGTMQLYELSSEGLVQLTDEAEPVTGRYVPGTDRVLVHKDDRGNERHQIYLLGDHGRLDPVVVDPRFIHLAGGSTRDGRLLAYRTNRANGVDFEIVVRDLAEGTDRTVFGGGNCMAGGFSPDGRWLGVIRSTEKAGDNESWLIDLDNGSALEIAAHQDEAYVSSPSWLPDSSGFYFATDTGRDVAGIAHFDLAAGSWDYVLEPGWECDCTMDWQGKHLLVVMNEDGASRAELRAPGSLELQAEVPLPGNGVATSWSFSRDGDRLAFQFSSATVPGDVWSLDIPDGDLLRMTTSPCSLDRADLVEPELHRFTSFDGESIPAFLYRRPAGTDVPVVVVVHGGPESQARPTWNPIVGYLAGSGYAVVVPNVRGSTGYGKRFQHLDDRRRRLDSVADLGALHDWLQTLEGVDARRAALFGGSYGGYMVLAGLVFQPERWAAGIDIVGISSLVTFLENTSAYRRRAREREYGFLDADHDFLVEASPLTHIDRLRAPLFIIHGANDPRVPLSEARQLHDVLETKGIPCELVVYEDEGHGLQKLANRLDAYPRAIRFLARVLAAEPEPASPKD